MCVIAAVACVILLLHAWYYCCMCDIAVACVMLLLHAWYCCCMCDVVACAIYCHCMCYGVCDVACFGRLLQFAYVPFDEPLSCPWPKLPSAQAAANYGYVNCSVCFGCCVLCSLQLMTAPMMLGLDGWWAVGPMLASYEATKMENRSAILFGQCWSLCSLLLQVSTGPHDDTWGWLGGESRARCPFLKMMSR